MVDLAIKTLVAEAFGHASAVLLRNRVVLDQAAADLLAKETLSKDDIAAIATQVMQDGPAAHPAVVAA